MIQMNLQKETHRIREELMLTRGEGTVREFGIGMCTPLYLKWITNKGSVYSTGNSAQYYVTT